MDIDKLMEKYDLTGSPVAFVAAANEYQTARHRPTPSEEVLISQIAGDLVDLDQGVALGALRGGGTKALHELARKIRHQAGRAPAITDNKPGPDQAAAARREVARRKANRRAHVVTVGG